MREILSHGYHDKNRDANRGVVKESLVKSVDPENYLIALLHQLLGTGNDIRDYLPVNMVDTLFDDRAQDLLDIHDDVENYETVKAELDDHLDITAEDLNTERVKTFTKYTNPNWEPTHFK